MTLPTQVNWSEFLGQHDLHFDALPQGWQEAPHFGNAMVGSMLYMHEGALILEIFRADVRDHRDERWGWTAYSRPHFRIGHFRLNTVGAPTGCSWRKDLWNAELTGTISTDHGEISLCHFVHADEMAIVTSLTPSEGERDLSWRWHPVAATTTRPGYPGTPEALETYAKRYGDHYRETLLPPQANPEGRLESHGDISVWVQALTAGGQYATAWAECDEGETRTHVATIANRFPETDAVETAVGDVGRFLKLLTQEAPSTVPSTRASSLSTVRGKPSGPAPAGLIQTHRKWWHAYYPRSYITIPDKPLEALYWQTIYRYGCCSREGRYYVDTSGLWFQGAQWPYTTNDWNTQSAHWGVYAANRLDQGADIVRRLDAHQEHLVQAVYPEAWREDSAYLHLATPGDFSGSRRSDMRYYDCVGCLPWLLHNAWCQYRFSMDDAMLREKIFPLLRRSINFYLHMVHDDAQGALHLAPTYSPEAGVFEDANFDLALFKWGCHILLTACERLGIDDPLIPRWQEVIARLADFPADEQGFMLGRSQTAWADHRHLSHLLMIYPLFLVNIEQSDAHDVLERSYSTVHAAAGSDDGAIEALFAMVQSHAAPIGTALGDGDRALEGLKRLQSELTPTGLWPCGNNPCIESTLSLANIIQDMLIQSWSDPALDESGPIRLFPAVPSEWPDIEFHNLRTEGAFLVSAKRSAGTTEWIRIKSFAGEPCSLKLDIPEGTALVNDQGETLAETDPGVYALGLEKGDDKVYRITQS